MGWREDLELLTALVAPPAAPYHGDVDWKQFEHVNGFLPPEDYRVFIGRYGEGLFDRGVIGELRMEQTSHPARKFADGMQWWRDMMRGAQVDYPDQTAPWPMWPDPGGF